MAPRTRQIRLQITGGIDDIEELSGVIQSYMRKAGIQEQEWALTFEVKKPFGNVGPMHKINLGFTSK